MKISKQKDTYCDMHAPSLSCSEKEKYMLGHKYWKWLDRKTFETHEHAKKGKHKKNIPQHQILHFDVHL